MAHSCIVNRALIVSYRFISMRRIRFFLSTPILVAIPVFPPLFHLQAQMKTEAWSERFETRVERNSNAVVTIRQQRDGSRTKASSNAEGDYEVPSLHVGVYNHRSNLHPAYECSQPNNITRFR